MRQAHLAARQPNTAGKLLAAGCAAIATIVLLDVAVESLAKPDRLPHPRLGEAKSVQPVSGPRNYNEWLKELDEAVAAAGEDAEARKDEWLVHEVLARRLVARGKLTGSYEDFRSAEHALQQAFQLAPAGTGPHLTLAQFNFTLHRLAQASRALDSIERYAVAPEAADRAEVAAIRGDIAFYQGTYPAALALYDEADRTMLGTSNFRRAVYHSKLGRPDLADKMFLRVAHSMEQPTRLALANIELQRGVLDLDARRLEQALEHFNSAARIFPGYWLIEEHIAEVMALSGDLAGASAMYLTIIQKTGHPEFMDALASVELKRGDAASATYWRRKAGGGWRLRLQSFPEAAAGHAIDHCLEKNDVGCALRLAQLNHAARPYGDAKIQLAEALLLARQEDKARSVLRDLARSGWPVPEAFHSARENAD